MRSDASNFLIECGDYAVWAAGHNCFSCTINYEMDDFPRIASLEAYPNYIVLRAIDDSFSDFVMKFPNVVKAESIRAKYSRSKKSLFVSITRE